MNEILNEIQKALQHKLYFLALSSTLTLPDICAALESDNNKTTGKKYKQWYNTYAYGKCSSFLDGHSCYKFRCSLLHQGSSKYSSEYNKSDFERIIFLEPNHTFFMHDNIINDALNLDIVTFCNGMIKAVRSWEQIVCSSETFKKNYSNTIKLYPNGLPPYIVGPSVIS